jgi:hypothetical protein
MRLLGPAVARTPTPLLRRVITSFIAQGTATRRPRESAAAHWLGYDHRDGAATFVRQIHSLPTSDTVEVAPRLPHLPRPTGVLWGGADRFPEALVQRAPGARPGGRSRVR